MFLNAIGLRSSYAESSAFTQGVGCGQIGLLIGADDAEYPWWAFTRTGVDERRIEHIGVQNASAAITPVPPFDPCVVLARTRPVTPAMTIDGRAYALDRSFGPIGVLRPGGAPLPLDAELSASVPIQWVLDEPQPAHVTVTATGTRPWPSQGRQATELSIVVSSAEARVNAPPRESRVALPAELEPGGTVDAGDRAARRERDQVGSGSDFNSCAVDSCGIRARSTELHSHRIACTSTTSRPVSRRGRGLVSLPREFPAQRVDLRPRNQKLEYGPRPSGD